MWRQRITIDLSNLTDVGLALPPEVVVPHPDALAGYLRAHRDLVDVVNGMAVALVEEFRGERSKLELIVDEDDYVDERLLVFNARAATYDQHFMDRPDSVYACFNDR